MGTGVDALPYVDALIKEYLLFRGFTATLSAFNKVRPDIWCLWSQVREHQQSHSTRGIAMRRGAVIGAEACEACEQQSLK